MSPSYQDAITFRPPIDLHAACFFRELGSHPVKNMPGERRSLRSNKESAPSTNGEKTRPDSQGSVSNKDKPASSRTASTKGKVLPTKKAGSNNSGKEMGDDKPKMNGAPVENGVNGMEDSEMTDDMPDHPKAGPGKEGEDEMTVVVPPPKSSKLAGEPPKDAEGDIDMASVEKVNTDSLEAEVDPKVKAVSG